jgi:Arc/MetJ-type ribon-helix-helix transcriptional regulator
MPSKTTTTVGVRIKNEHIAVIDELVRLQVFPDRSEAVRFMVTPVYEMFSTAWNSNSKLSAVKARMKSEKEVMGKLNGILQAMEADFKLEGEGGLEAQPA